MATSCGNRQVGEQGAGRKQRRSGRKGAEGEEYSKGALPGRGHLHQCRNEQRSNGKVLPS